MPSVRFFTDKDALPEQLAAGAFGPVSGSETTEYRVSSMFTGIEQGHTDLNVYPIMPGQLIVVNNPNDTTLINIILKPNVDWEKDYEGIPRVKFFIYRGIKLGGFFTNNANVFDIIPQDPSNNFIVSEAHSFDTQNGITGTPQADSLEGSYTSISGLPDSTALDDLWYAEDYHKNTIANSAATVIGQFDSTKDYGIEILLDEDGFNPTLEIAREGIHILDTAGLNAAALHLKRLEVLSYLDPAAFYGAFCQRRVNGTREVYSVLEGSQPPYSRNDIFQHFVSKFASKHRVYVDLRNQYDLPPTIDTVSDRFDQVRISLTQSSPPPSVSYASNTSWPIKIIDITSAEFSTLVQDGVGTDWYAKYHLFISLPEVPSHADGSDQRTILHCITNHLNESWDLGNPSGYNTNKRYVKLNYSGTTPDWSDTVTLAIFRTDTGSNTYVPTASYIRLQYSRINDDAFVEDQVFNYQLHNLPILNPTNQFPLNVVVLPPEPQSITEEAGTNAFIRQSGQLFYTEARGKAFEACRLGASDQFGCIAAIFRAKPQINVHGITLSDDWIPDFCTEILEFEDGAIHGEIFTEETSLYTYLSQKYIEENFTYTEIDSEGPSEYDDLVNTHNYYKRSPSVFSIHKVQLQDSSSGNPVDVNCLESRVNDPTMLKGLHGNSPFDTVVSVAFTYAEAATINSEAMTNFASTRYAYISLNGTPQTLTNTDHRDAYKASLKLTGMTYNAVDDGLDMVDFQINTIDLYTLDGITFTTELYATAHPGLIMTNDIVPNFLPGGDNPFGNANLHGLTYASLPATPAVAPIDSIRNALNTIKTQAITEATTYNTNNVSENLSGEEIFYAEIRDYMYSGELDNLTFEIAFRLPFYIRNIRRVPYSNYALISSANNSDFNNMGNGYDHKTFNNPFIRSFDDWFDLANDLTDLQINPGLVPLERTGLRGPYPSHPNGNDPYAIFHLTDTFNTIGALATHQTPAYEAKVMHEENPLRIVGPGILYDEEPHLPVNPPRDINDLDQDNNTRERLYPIPHTLNATDLQVLDNAGVNVLSSDKITRLLALTANQMGYAELDSQPANVTIQVGGQNTTIDLSGTQYIVKLSTGSNFMLYSQILMDGNGNGSGITLGFGFDMGQQYGPANHAPAANNNFDVYTPYNTNNNPNWQTILNENIEYVQDASTTTRTLRDILDIALARIVGGQQQFGARRLNAMALRSGFWDVLWGRLDWPIANAIEDFPVFMREQYLQKVERNIACNRTFSTAATPNTVLRVRKELNAAGTAPNLDYFHTSQIAGTDQYMNEVEKFILLTSGYNGSTATSDVDHRLNGWARRTARYLCHAVNTHDVRWMTLVLAPPLNDNITANHWFYLFGTRRTKNHQFVKRVSAIQHYRTIN